MTQKALKNIRLIAVDLDGPLLVDTFSPIMHKLCTEYYGVEYSRELERNTFSRARAEVVSYMRDYMKERMSDSEKGQSDDQAIASYFQYREAYMREHPHGLKPEVPAFLEFLSSLDVPMICYGGLAESYMRESLGAQADRFLTYVCTNDFRPGVKQIVQDLYHLQPHEALFIDDVNFVAEHAKALRVPFIGVPSTEPWSWQKHDMRETGVRHLVDSVAQIDLAMLRDVDQRATQNGGW